MNRNTLHDLAFALALGSATLAWAGSASHTTGNHDATTNAMTTAQDSSGSSSAMGATDANRMPANRATDATHACANVAASDKESCMARWNARHNNMRNRSDRQNGSGMGAMDKTNPPATNSQGTPNAYPTDSIPNGSSTPGTSGK